MIFSTSQLSSKFKESKSVYKYYYLKVQGEALGRVLGKYREMCNVDMVRNTNDMQVSFMENGKKVIDDSISLFDIIDSSEKKTVIFTSYTEVVKELDTYLKENGYKPLMVYADTNKNLSDIISKFEKDEDINPLIATFDSLSTAVPLIMANSVVLMNSPFRAHEYDQSTSRVDRIGQTEIVRIYNLFLDTGTEPNISTRSDDIIRWSREQVAGIMGVDVGDVATLESICDIQVDMHVKQTLPQLKPNWIGW